MTQSVSLVGFSLGTQVIKTCLKTLNQLGATNIIHNDTTLTASFDYFGAHIGGEVEELQIDYSREVSHATQPDRYKQKLHLNLFGEVLKQISVSGSRYNIAYA